MSNYHRLENPQSGCNTPQNIPTNKISNIYNHYVRSCTCNKFYCIICYFEKDLQTKETKKIQKEVDAFAQSALGRRLFRELHSAVREAFQKLGVDSEIEVRSKDYLPVFRGGGSSSSYSQLEP